MLLSDLRMRLVEVDDVSAFADICATESHVTPPFPKYQYVPLFQ